MRIAKIELAGRTAPAVIVGDEARLIAPWSDGQAPDFLPTTLALADIKRRVAETSQVVPLKEVTFATPSGTLTKFICLGLNYRSHVEETNSELPPQPALFTKFADVLVGHDRPLVRPRESEQFDYEGEIAVVIGTGGRHIPRERALDHVFGYTILHDGSVRDFQRHSPSAGKNFWRSGAVGPWIVTADEIPDPSILKLETRLNGATVQSATADLMLYDIPTAIAYISRWTPLSPGDIIATGTPAGVGAQHTPPLWLKAGDVVEIEVSGVGILRNPVVDEA